jgi:hypothetical protein
VPLRDTSGLPRVASGGASRGGCPGASRGWTWLELERKRRTRFAGASAEHPRTTWVVTSRRGVTSRREVTTFPRARTRREDTPPRTAARTSTTHAPNSGRGGAAKAREEALARRRAEEQKHEAASESAAKPPRKSMASNPYQQAKAPAQLLQRSLSERRLQRAQAAISHNTGSTGNTSASARANTGTSTTTCRCTR